MILFSLHPSVMPPYDVGNGLCIPILLGESMQKGCKWLYTRRRKGNLNGWNDKYEGSKYNTWIFETCFHEVFCNFVQVIL